MTTATWSLIDAIPLTPSEVNICNRALMHVGVSALIETLTESTAESRACRVAYGPARDELLEVHPWSFAIRRALLVPAVDEPARSGWGYVYAMPADALRPIEVSGEAPFELEHGLDGQVLLTDAEGAEVQYIARVPNAERFPPLFAAALARRIAIDLVTTLPVRPELVPGLAGMAAQALALARTADLRAAKRKPLPDSPSITARQ